ncbi:endoribonuclease L-PSP [Acetobacter aceti NRIC 0242]|uniref:Uncharacterized protein n=2 Tax=Acetobacter aceti TaxID=435 RepID=A0A6S6PG53_ACEAC|nr:Rid family hydrolase [Acetobacter aceti]GBO81938.1 endoribonuclease L-PSP [Acetobacter aceti NRIC 0242]TCS32983.1 endoribonuclease L-PSP [Acetobacter aceti NBRC 14818]BCI65601.1 hypothetical protein AAJCM20276_02250 [Acetobacter aceti]BCK76411.1 hypothetical protein EMQ_2017 [Acetobacter aceti NBRC 14818]GAN56153.1 endoribonuclease L-PSP [Acetobacter aceti NBRC 14818]
MEAATALMRTRYDRPDNAPVDSLLCLDTVQPSYEHSHEGMRVRHLRGFDSRTGDFPPRISDQCRLAFSAGDAALSTRGASLQDVVRVVYLVKDASKLSSCGSFASNALGDNRPATTVLVVKKFDRPEVEIELELIARIPEDALAS